MNKYLLYFLFYTAINCFSQVNLTVTFENKLVANSEQVKNLPKGIQEEALKQLQSTVIISTMTINKNIVYIVSISKSQKKTTKKNVQIQSTDGKKSSFGEISTNVKSPNSKILKNATKNTYTEKIDGKIVTKTLSKINWKITNKTKKILGYTCQEAIGTYNNKPITIYFTKELKTKASPELLPFIDGVVLEYNTGRMKGIAIKIEKNQPDTKDFFKN